MEVVDVESGPRGLRVVVDRPGGVELDALADATRAVSSALEAAQVAGPRGSYNLEVSSPGVERVLRTPDHFRRFVGTTVAVKTRPGTPGDRRVKGRLVAADEAAIVVEAGGGFDAGPRQLPYDQIERATTVLDWGPTAGPGGRPTSSARPGPGRKGSAGRGSAGPCSAVISDVG